ncbi:MAG TPA: SDR family NAD(P)-dependent oxidoreductase [Longimicrobiales bacterium]|nr:SDR family NAD(P)-dependent oxidoreductase [Longimicrobiales bacterium]
MSLLAGRTALVSGASRGIGLAICRVLAEDGARVHALARDPEPAAGVARSSGGEIWAVDLADDAAVWDAVDRLQEADGAPPDIVVACAGAFGLAPVAEVGVSEFDHMIAVNLRGTFLLYRALLPALLARDAGDLVTIGSVSGRKAFPANGAYAASKYGQRGLHEVLVEELRGTGVRATLVEPAATDTSLWDPLDPDGDPDLPGRAAMLHAEDVAEAVRFAVTRPPHVRVPLLQIERG